MCRIAGYLGPAIRLSALMGDASHGLIDQRRNATQMHAPSVAGDGWGIGWFRPGADPKPGLLKNVLPLWSDEYSKTMPRALLSGSIVSTFASPARTSRPA